MSTLASRLELARKNAKLTQSAIAERVGISQPTYQKEKADEHKHFTKPYHPRLAL